MKQTTAQKANQKKYVFKIPILNDFVNLQLKKMKELQTNTATKIKYKYNTQPTATTTTE